MNLLPVEPLYHGGHKNTNDSNFILYRDPDSSLKGPLSLNSFIQPKRNMAESSSIGTIIPWGHKNTNDNNFILYRGPGSSLKGPLALNAFIQPKRYIY